ncbi:MAG: hypothetical protein V3U92_05115 [Cellulophaga sp.]
MKTFILSTKFLILILTTLPLAMCSSDDDGEAEISFEPIEITFTEDFFTDCNEVKTVNDVSLSIRALSVNEKPGFVEEGEAWEIPECTWRDYRLSEIPNSSNHPWRGSVRLFMGFYDCLEIDISKIKGASKVTLSIDDQCNINSFTANLYEGSSVVSTEGNKLYRAIEDIVLDNINDKSTKIRVWACEGSIGKITIE